MANEKVKQAAEMLEKGVAEIIDSGRLTEWLDVMSRFHRYSARNTILIWIQNPEATHVAGYKAWKQKFNRQVRKGEKAISILAPIKHKSVIRETDKLTGEVTDHEHIWLSFKTVPVFDISQTDGDELPTITTDLAGNVEGFGELCEKVESATTATVVYGCEFADPECHGSYNRLENAIRIAEGMSEAQTFKTLVHEIAHSLLHCQDNEHRNDSKELREVQAEGVAYIVCHALGIDAGDYSFGYIAGWGEDTKAILNELSTIQQTASAILDKVA